MRADEFITKKWSQKYKNSINCSHPKGFSQRAHCAGKQKHNEDITMEAVCPDCGMCQTHGNLNEIKKGQQDANGYTRCWPGKHAEGTKKGRNGGQVRNCVPNESVTEGHSDQQRKVFKKNGHPVGEVGIDRESSPGVGQWYMKHYASGKDLAGYDSFEEAVAELKHCMKQGVAENKELAEEFDLIENIIEDLADRNGVDSEVIWGDLESLTDDELYVFATTTTVMETEAWQKANKKDKTDGMSRKAVKAYRREHPGSKLKTAVTTKPSKLKKGSKASKRRKSYCSRSRGQMKMHNISCAKTPDKAICKARRRWNC